MNIKRFFANNSRDALALVRKALGPDAVILANRSVNGGNEIMALGSEDMDALATSSAMMVDDVYIPSSPKSSPELKHEQDNREQLRRELQPERAKPAPRAYVEPEEDDLPSLSFSQEQQESLLSYVNKSTQSPARAPQPAARKAAPNNHAVSSPFAYEDEMESTMLHRPQYEPERTPSVKAHAAKPDHAKAEIDSLMSEMRTMRGAIESQLSELVWESTQRRDPSTSAVLRNLLASGFAPGLARRLVERMPSNQTVEEAQKWVEGVLVKNMAAIENESEILDKGGIFAIIGPTGVGKTTTIAKLAARYVMKHGTSKLALITTDAYRIGGYEQLRIYGKILGVMVHSVKDESDLKLVLNELKGKHTILIDTVGVNQRDSMVAAQLEMLSGNNINRLLCINATCTAETLTDVVNTYQGKGLAGCIMTKLDEASTIGSTLDVVIREKLKLYYVTNGQRVPEDIHLANKKMLIHHAFKLNKRLDGHFKFRDEELPLVMAHAEKISNAKFDEELSFD